MYYETESYHIQDISNCGENDACTWHLSTNMYFLYFFFHLKNSIRILFFVQKEFMSGTV